MLKKLDESGILDTLDIDELIMLKKKQKYLDMHPYAKWQSKDGKYWYTTFPDSTRERGVRQIRRNTLVELDAAIIEFWDSHKEKITIRDVFDEWNDTRLELKKISASTHERNMYYFNKHYVGWEHKFIEDLTPQDFADFLERQIPAHDMTSKNFSSLRGITKGFLKWGRKKGYINYADVEVFSLMDVSDRSFKKVLKEDCEEVFDEEETSKVMEFLIQNPDLRNYGVLLMFVTGIRVGELVALKVSDIVDNVVKIRRTETREPNPDGAGYVYEVRDFPKTKAGVRDVVVPDDYVWLLDELCKDRTSGYVFVGDDGKRFTTNVFRRRLERVCKAVGIPARSPHKIRKTYGSILLDHNVDARFVISQMGHTDLGVTENHYHRNRRSNEEKSEILSKIPDFKKTS